MTKIITNVLLVMSLSSLALIASMTTQSDNNITNSVVSEFKKEEQDTYSEAQSIIRAASYGKQIVYDDDKYLNELTRIEKARNANGVENNATDNNATDNNATKKLAERKKSKEEEKALLMKKYGLLSGADKNESLFYNETLLNWTRMAKNANPRGKEIAAAKGTFVVAAKVDTNSSNSTTNKGMDTVVVKGYCYITENIEVGKQPGALRTECQTNVGAITMFANLVNVNQQSSLIVDPKYIERKGVRYDVKSSIVTNENKTSYNVATFVNDTKIAQVGWTALGAGADEIKTASNEYLQAIQDSKETEQVIPIADSQGNTTTTTVTNTDPPDPLNYLTKAVIHLSASALRQTADLYKADLPYLYYIAAETKIWIDLKVNKQGEYVR